MRKDKRLWFAATWIELEGVRLIEMSQKEEYKYQMILLICRVLRNKTRVIAIPVETNQANSYDLRI